MTPTPAAPAPDSPLRVALVEDQSGLRESIQAIFARTPDLSCLAACATAEEALAVLPGLRPQVVFMDINLPGMDGIAGVRELSKVLPDTFFIMLTVRDNTDAVFNSMAAGACGYLHKPVTGAKLAEAAHEVVAGGSPMSAKIARLVVQAFKKPTPAEVKKSPAEALTMREQEVLDQLMGGYSYKDVAANLQISPHTVHFHIRTIYKKLQVRSRAEAVAKVMKG